MDYSWLDVSEVYYSRNDYHSSPTGVKGKKGTKLHVTVGVQNSLLAGTVYVAIICLVEVAHHVRNTNINNLDSVGLNQETTLCQHHLGYSETGETILIYFKKIEKSYKT